MKKIFCNSRLIAIALIAVFTSAFNTSAMAGDEKNLPVELKFIGGYNSHSIVQLNIAGNELQNEFTVIIRDEYGNTIYRQHLKGEKIIQKFLFNTDELGDDRLEFEVYCRKTNKSVVYTLNRQSALQESLLVKELK